MAEVKQEATTFGCDAPKCTVVHVTVGEQEPPGRRISTQGPYVEALKAYACKPVHIRPAIEAVEEAAAKAAELAEEDPRTEGGQDAGEEPRETVTEDVDTEADEVVDSYLATSV